MDDPEKWKRGNPYHPNNPEVFKVRRYLFINGSKRFDSLRSALPSISEELLKTILAELQKQGIIKYVTSA
jgi:DNA-binding HxlR family transcriptional regulator